MREGVISLNSLDKKNIEKNLPPEVFVETSIHLARLKGKHMLKRVDGELSKFSAIGTSTYVKLEYGNNILKFATYCLRKLKEFKDLEILRYHITNCLIPRAYPFHEQYQRWFSNILSEHFNKPEATERAIRTLRSLLTLGTDKVSSICDVTIDNISCVWAEQDCSKWSWKTPGTCENKSPGCKIDIFFKENIDYFLMIKNTIQHINSKEHTKELDAFVDIIDKAINEPSILRNYKNCRSLADAIIAVQSKQGPKGYSSFFTQNIKESRVLCRPLKQLLIYLPQQLDSDIEYRDNRNLK